MLARLHVRLSSHSPLQRSGFPLAPAVRRACHSVSFKIVTIPQHRDPPIGGYGADGEQTATPTDRSPDRDMGVVREEYIARFPTLVLTIVRMSPSGLTSPLGPRSAQGDGADG